VAGRALRATADQFDRQWTARGPWEGFGFGITFNTVFLFPGSGRNPDGSNVIAAAEQARPQPAQEETTMKYMLLIYGNEAGMLSASKETVSQMMAAYTAYTEAMKKAGVHVGSDRLRPTSSASAVRVTGGKTQVLDGPYAETKEQLGGYYMIEVPDLDAALSWAARCPGAAHGTIEVRPLWVM
jgi:hypothetical protein